MTLTKKHKEILNYVLKPDGKFYVDFYSTLKQEVAIIMSRELRKEVFSFTTKTLDRLVEDGHCTWDDWYHFVNYPMKRKANDEKKN